MLLTTIKKQSTINCLKFALAALGILVINILAVFRLLAVDPTPSPLPESNTINLKVCLKDESNQPFKSSSTKNLPLTIVGGKSPLNLPLDDKSCGLVGKSYEFAKSKQYVILAPFQGDKGVKMTTRYFDPASYAINPGVPDAPPQVIEITIKDGINIIDGNGNPMIYNGANTSTLSDSNTNTAVNSSGSNNAGVANNSSVADNSGGAGGGYGIYFPSWTNIISFLSFLSFLGVLAIIVRLFFVHPVPENQVAQLSAADLKDIEDELKQTITETVSKLPPPSVNIPEMLNLLKDLIAEEKARGETETPPHAEIKPPVVADKPHSTISPQVISREPDDGQIRKAVRNYWDLINGLSVEYIELQPTGETSPEYMIGHQGIRLHEQRGGKYVAFPLDSVPNQAWIFPAVNLRFTESAFSLIFPHLTKEDYEGGKITPRKAVKQHNNTDAWLVV